jgi:hypothetical protein
MYRDIIIKRKQLTAQKLEELELAISNEYPAFMKTGQVYLRTKDTLLSKDEIQGKWTMDRWNQFTIKHPTGSAMHSIKLDRFRNYYDIISMGKIKK